MKAFKLHTLIMKLLLAICLIACVALVHCRPHSKEDKKGIKERHEKEDKGRGQHGPGDREGEVLYSL